MKNKGKKILSVVSALTIATASASLAACSNKEQPTSEEMTLQEIIDKKTELQEQLNQLDQELYNKHGALLEENEKLQNELNEALSKNTEYEGEIEELKKKLEVLENRFALTDKLLSTQELLESIEDEIISVDYLSADELMKKIATVETNVGELLSSSIITKAEANTILNTLADVEKELFYSVYANGVNALVENKVVLENQTLAEVGKKEVRFVTLSDFDASRTVSLISRDDEVIEAMTLDNLQKRQTVVGETYDEKEINTLNSATDFANGLKKSYKQAVDAATELSYSSADGYKIKTKSSYNDNDCLASIEYSIDKDGMLSSTETTYTTKDNKEIATVSCEYGDYSSKNDYFKTLYQRADKILNEQKELLAKDDQKENE